MAKTSKKSIHQYGEEPNLFLNDKKSTRSPLLKKKLRQKKFQLYFSLPFWLGITTIIVLIITFWFSGFLTTFQNFIVQKFHQSAKTIGFTIKDIIITGRNKVPTAVLTKAIGVKVGDAITEHDIEGIKSRLQQIDWVKDCVVYRQLPDQFYIQIIERYPIALWHNQKHTYVVDNMGVAILVSTTKDYANLPNFSGEGAPEKAHDVLKTLEEYPIVKNNLTSLNRIRNRRWDLVLFNKIVIKLPEEALNQETFENSLKRLSKLLNLKTITPENTVSVDLRMENKQFIQKK
ncbi:MAG: cell division protein FtsQ/DivIB [Proteobacteria bacterium]|nr:cell division protein FtsQ/DivIB [Pseudomonadota bacterium]